jgi:hypothetical protein
VLDNTLGHRSEPNLSWKLWKCEHGETVTQFRVESLKVTVAFAELPSASPACHFKSIRGIILEILRSNNTDVKHATCSGMLNGSVHADDKLLEPKMWEGTTEAETNECNQLKNVSENNMLQNINLCGLSNSS